MPPTKASAKREQNDSHLSARAQCQEQQNEDEADGEGNGDSEGLERALLLFELTAEVDVVVARQQASGPPGHFGGNMDLKHLTAGTNLFLPVFRAGAQFYTGDPHSAQGDGEVSGTAIEHSLSGVFRFILHKGKTIEWPRAENDDEYILMGIDLDLNRAMRIATLEVIKFLVEEKGLTQAKAFSLASIAVDFKIAEVVDGTQVVTGHIPKSLFLKKRHRGRS